MIYVKINENGTISAFETTVSDSIKYETIKFEFPKKWQGYSKTAVFRNKDTILNVVLENTNDLCISDEECYIPYEVLKPPYFTVSVFGVFEDSRVTTEEAEIKVIQSGYGEGGEPTEPTPTEYEQLINLVNETKQIAQSVRDDADNGLFMGKSVECDQTYNPNSKEAQSGKAVAEALSSKQDELVSGENIKTINGESVLGKGNIEIEVPTIKIDQIYSPTSENAQSGKAVNEAVGNKQDTLVSGENIKTVNGESVLGQGDIVITQPTIDQTYNETSENAQSGKAVAEAVFPKADTTYLNNNFANAFKKNKIGKVVSLNDVSPVEHRLKVKVSSKNLIPIANFETQQSYNDIDKTNGNWTLTNNKDGTYTINGASNGFEFVRIGSVFVKKGVTYTLSGCDGASGSTYQLYAVGDGLALYTANNNSTQTATLDCELRIFVVLYEGQTLNNFVIKPQLEVGDKKTDFEPYVSSQTVRISKIGKNLAPIATTTTLVDKGGITITNNYDGTYTVNGTALMNESIEIVRFNVVKGVTYTLSGCVGGSDSTYQLYIDGDKGNLKVYCPDPIKNYNQLTGVAKGSGEVRLRLVVYEGQTLNNFVIKPQLEVGDKITDFEAYIQPETVTVDTNGTIKDLTSFYPTTTLLSDNNGVIIDCEYNAKNVIDQAYNPESENAQSGNAVAQAIGQYELIMKLILGYSVLTSEPEDWETNFASYYENTGTLKEPVYTQLTKVKQWENGKFYSYSSDEVKIYEINTEPDGTNFCFKGVIFNFAFQPASANKNLTYTILKDKSPSQTSVLYEANVSTAIKTTASWYQCCIETMNSGIWTGVENANYTVKPIISRQIPRYEPMRALRFGNLLFPAGSTITIYGVRAQ